MNSILKSIKPKWVAKILNGEKTVEVSKTAPKDWVDYLSGKTDKKPGPKTVYIYCTKGDRYLLNKWAVSLWGYEAITLNKTRDPKVTAHITPESKCVLNGKVVAKFTLREVEKCVNPMFPEGTFATKTVTYENLLDQSCLNAEQFDGYLGKGGRGYAWYISDLLIFDRPKELEQFEILNLSGVRWVSQRSTKGLPNRKRPPQSWCYCEEVRL